jgi:biofilm PGA synthesis protein PgaD
MSPPIIDRDDLQLPAHWTVTALLTFGFWLFWLYLWLPLLALLAWAAGLQQAYRFMVTLGGWEEVLRLAVLYTAIIVLLGGSLVGWATYNILRYGPKGRRAANSAPDAEQVARHFGQGPIAVETWRRAQRLHVVHGDAGVIERVDILSDGTPAPGLTTR